jgi:dolichol-phosphate mannosyltransferase
MAADADRVNESELLTVVIPCYNEEGTVGEAVGDVLRVAGDLPVALKIVLIDDCSTDGTLARMKQICDRHPECALIANATNQGLGNSVRSAYEQIEDHSWVTVLPGDNELMFESIHNFLELRNRYDVVLGYLQNPVIRTLPRRFASWAFSTVVRILYGFEYRYLNGTKMYKLEAYKGLEVISSGHAYSAEIMAKALLRNPALRVGEAPFAARGRASGASKAFRPSSIWRAFVEVFRGYRSVSEYRKEVLRQRAAGGSG